MAVLLRYTLRLLTLDQLLRASRLVCALELLRRSRQDLGTVESAIATVFGPNIDYAAWLDEVASGADDSDDDIARLRLVCLHVAGVSP